MAQLVEQTLASFLAAYSCKPWQPGTVDCCLMLAAWAIWLGHRDPAQHLRGTYSTDEGFRAITQAAGSVFHVVECCAQSIGLKRVPDPSCGDVGVIGSAFRIDRQFGAIYDGDRWLIRFIDRIAPMTARPLAIWRL